MGLASSLIGVAKTVVKSGTLDDAARVVKSAAPGLADDAVAAVKGIAGGIGSTAKGAAEGWRGASGGLVSKLVHAGSGASRAAGEAVLGSSTAAGVAGAAATGVSRAAEALSARGLTGLGTLLTKTSDLVGRAGGAAAATKLGQTVVGAGTIGAVGLGAAVATGHGEAVESVGRTVGNVVDTGANLLEGGAHMAGGAVSLVGSGTEAVTDLGEALSGVVADVTAGDLGGAFGRIGQYATEHPLACALGVGGGALLLGGGGALSKVALAGVGLMLGKTLIEKASTGDAPAKVTEQGLGGKEGVGAESQAGVAGMDQALDAYQANLAREAQVMSAGLSAEAPVAQQDMPAFEL